MKNTITLVLAQKGMDEDGIRGLIEGNTGLQNPKKRTMPNSILVPVGGIKTGDSMGLVRGTSFGFKLLRVARNPGDKLAVHSARIMYNSLMHTLGLPNIGITDEEIIALAAPLEQNQLVAALKKLTDSIPAEAVELEERLELYRQSRIYLKAA